MESGKLGLFCTFIVVSSLFLSNDLSAKRGHVDEKVSRTMENSNKDKKNSKPHNDHSHYLQKLVVITGVSRGLGRVMTEKFIKNGWRVAGCARSKEAIETMRKSYGKENDFQMVDVTDDKAVARWAQKVIKRYGVPDVIINNAAIINKQAPLWTISAKEFNDVLTIDVIGTANVIRAFVPSMVDHKKGIIINISSSSGREADEGFAPYCAAKFAIEGLTKSLAQELPKGVIAVALDPGTVGTDMIRECYPSALATSPSPDQWANKAFPFILEINAKDNGKSLTIKM